MGHTSYRRFPRLAPDTPRLPHWEGGDIVTVRAVADLRKRYCRPDMRQGPYVITQGTSTQVGGAGLPHTGVPGACGRCPSVCPHTLLTYQSTLGTLFTIGRIFTFVCFKELFFMFYNGFK